MTSSFSKTYSPIAQKLLNTLKEHADSSKMLLAALIECGVQVPEGEKDEEITTIFAEDALAFLKENGSKITNSLDSNLSTLLKSVLMNWLTNLRMFSKKYVPAKWHCR
jgi:hypothetical protein